MAIHSRSSAGNSTRYVHRDHLDSVVALTDENGTIAEAYSFDAFGKRRNLDWTADNSDLLFAATQLTERGFTGHEQLDNVRLVHMNGRVQDPITGRMISADPYVPDPMNSQSYNRYSYVRNNPLSLVDPSGFNEQDPSSPEETSWFCRWLSCEETSSDGYTEDSFCQRNLATCNIPGGGAFDEFNERDIATMDAFEATQDCYENGNCGLYISATSDERVQNDLVLGITWSDVGETIVDFTPIVGDIKGFVDAYNDPTLVNITAAVVGLAGPLGDGAAKILKGAANPVVRDAINKGTQAHRDFAAKVDAKPGWEPNPRLKDPETGRTLIPDALTPSGRPVELKPNTPSGRRQGAKQLGAYERATGMKGRIVYYDSSDY